VPHSPGVLLFLIASDVARIVSLNAQEVESLRTHVDNISVERGDRLDDLVIMGLGASSVGYELLCRLGSFEPSNG
jgi:hypothetical protein